MKNTTIALAALFLASCGAPEEKSNEETKVDPSINSIETYVGKIEYQNQTLKIESADHLRHQFRLQRASQLVCWSMPAVSFYKMFEAYRAMSGAGIGDPVILLCSGYDGVYPWLTANVTTPYTISFLDLNETGPVIVEIPAGGVYGVANDAWQQPIKEINSGQAETLLFVGPGQEVPASFKGEVVHSNTFKMLYFYRVLGTTPEAEALKKAVRTYKWSDRANPPETKYVEYLPKAGNTDIIATPPTDFEYWKVVNDYVQSEPLADRDRFFYAWLQDLGMEKGKTFEPSEYQLSVLNEGLEVGMAMAQSTAFDSFFPAAHYGEDSGWDLVLAGLDTKVDIETYSMFNQRLSYTYEAATTSRGMTDYVEGRGSAYLGAYYDDNGDALMGAHNYSVRIEPNPPAKNFWSVTVYDAKNRLIIRNETRKSDISSRMENLQTNEDGSVDLYFGPESPEGKESNWVQTNPGESFFLYLRLYGPLNPFKEQTWPLNRVKRVN